MTIEAYSLPRSNIITWISQLDLSAGHPKPGSTQNDFPAVEILEWFKLARGQAGDLDVTTLAMSVTDSSSIYGHTLQSMIRPSMTTWERLETASAQGNETEFIAAAKLMDWENCTAEDYIKAIKLALSAAAYLKARLLATDGAKRYHEDAKLQKYAHVLAPPKVLPNRTPADPTIRKNRDWMMEHGIEYRGRWVALRAGFLLATASSMKELSEQVENKKGVLLTKVY